jgi:hypothetical protein
MTLEELVATQPRLGEVARMQWTGKYVRVPKGYTVLLAPTQDVKRAHGQGAVTE